MRRFLHRAGVTFVALSLALCSVPPASAATPPASDTANAVALMNSGCGIPRSGAPTPAEAAAAQAVLAQAETAPAPDASAAPDVSPSPAAAPSSSPSPTPSPYVPLPVAPGGPQVLIPRVPSPTVTPPPLPSASPSPSGSPGPVIIAPASAPPSGLPTTPAPVITSGPIVRATPAPAPSGSATPAPGPTLAPGDYAILGDRLSGTNKPGQPQDLDGHVNIIYQDGTLAGDHAHYDGTRYIDITGHTFITNRENDTIFYADSVRFDTLTQQATLINGHGETTQGVEHGKLHFSARDMVTDHDGVTHGSRAFVTTCENPRGGYHLEGKTIDVYPGDKAVIKSALLYLGGLAIFFLPVVVISLRHETTGTRRQPGFIPLIGYDAFEGFWVKARVGFSPSDYYYGYYRIEAYTKLGFGLGYVGTIKRKDGKRQTDINFFRQRNVQTGDNNNISLNDQENFSRTTRGTLAFNYTGVYSPTVSLPPQYQLAAAVNHGDAKGDTQTYSFQRSATSNVSSQNNYGFTDHRVFSQRFSNDTSVSLTTSDSTSFYGAPALTTDTLHFQTLTHYASNAYDYDLTYDHYDSNLQNNVQKEPELTIHPLYPLFPGFKAIPVTAQYVVGQYQDPLANIAASRGQGQFQIGPGLAHVWGSDFSGQITVLQDLYSTGDQKAQIAQQFSLTSPFAGHFLNTLSYTESHVNGPLAEPFQQIDVMSTGLKQANDVLRIFNNDTYSFSLTGTTFFNRQAQAVGYQLTSRPSARSMLLLGGAFTPGPGMGFDRTSVQLATPFGRDSDLQIATFVDWKNHGRLESKNIYYRHVVGDCYEIRLSYNEDLKQVSLTVNLLAFPSQAANFGIGQTASLNGIIPQAFSGSPFSGGTGY